MAVELGEEGVLSREVHLRGVGSFSGRTHRYRWQSRFHDGLLQIRHLSCLQLTYLVDSSAQKYNQHRFRLKKRQKSRRNINLEEKHRTADEQQQHDVKKEEEEEEDALKETLN